MGLTDGTRLYATEVECNLEPVVLFSIVDHFNRRDEGQEFVMGTLLGTDEDGVVQIHSCFPVPYQEAEGQIALNSDFHTTMLGLQQRVTPALKVVGWYSTGEAVNEKTILIHEFYTQDVARPVHLLLDLGLSERRMSTKAYVSSALSLGETQLGTSFLDVKVTVLRNESDRVGIDTLLKMTSAGASGAGGSAGADADSVEATIKKLLATLDGVVGHVDKVVKGGAAADPAVVALLQQLVAAAPRLPTDSFEKMFNTQVQDMLTIVYLANLTQTQLALAEKLQSVALAGN